MQRRCLKTRLCMRFNAADVLGHHCYSVAEGIVVSVVLWLFSLPNRSLCLMSLFAQDELRDAVLLVFANKQDLPNAMNAAEITDKLGLHSLRQRHWCVAHSSVLHV